MATQTQEEHMREEPRVPHWNIATRIAFRFCFVYLGLFVVYFCPIWLKDLLFMKGESPLVLGGIWPMRQMVFSAGAHIFSHDPPTEYKAWINFSSRAQAITLRNTLKYSPIVFPDAPNRFDPSGLVSDFITVVP
jgi:hypothetical protein